MFSFSEPLECHGVRTGPCRSAGAGYEAMVGGLDEHRA